MPWPRPSGTCVTRGAVPLHTEPNLNKVIIEREGSIDESKLAEVMREAFARVAPR